MIKICINNVTQKKAEYLATIIKLVEFRVSVLRKSLSHLKGSYIDPKEDYFKSFKPTTKKIIELVGDEPPSLNSRPGYIKAVNDYLSKGNKLANINLNGLHDLCTFLLANNNENLSKLLVCDAKDLVTLNNKLLNSYSLNRPLDIEVIKLAFDYQAFDEIGSLIRNFFRSNIFSRICAYCNIEPVVHQKNVAGEDVTSYELDHFYDKARIPLLSYSFFNLVPSDHACNVINKGEIKFSEEYHMNPYEMGYSDRIQFVPVGLTPSFDVARIEVRILEPPNTFIYKKINGDRGPNDIEKGKLGNLNVFKIRSKYEIKLHLAGQIISTIHYENKHLKHIEKFIRNWKSSVRKASYKRWYEKTLDVHFDEANFHNKPFSKFCRDLHDYYFSKRVNMLNRYIIDLIRES